MAVRVRIRRLVARHPSVRWSLVTTLAVAAGALVWDAGADVDDARAAWGRTRTVLVAVEPIAPGDRLHDAVERRQVPEPVVADDAPDHLDADAVARQHVGAGEIIGAADVAPGVGRTALLQHGDAAVAIAEAVPSGARPGERVEVVVGGVVIAGDATVLAVEADTVLVAVAVGDAPEVAAATLDGSAALVVLP
jgi:hypothetical protein